MKSFFTWLGAGNKWLSILLAIVGAGIIGWIWDKGWGLLDVAVWGPEHLVPLLLLGGLLVALVAINKKALGDGPTSTLMSIISYGLLAILMVAPLCKWTWSLRPIHCPDMVTGVVNTCHLREGCAEPIRKLEGMAVNGFPICYSDQAVVEPKWYMNNGVPELHWCSRKDDVVLTYALVRADQPCPPSTY